MSENRLTISRRAPLAVESVCLSRHETNVASGLVLAHWHPTAIATLPHLATPGHYLSFGHYRVSAFCRCMLIEIYPWAMPRLFRNAELKVSFAAFHYRISDRWHVSGNYCYFHPRADFMRGQTLRIMQLHNQIKGVGEFGVRFPRNLVVGGPNGFFPELMLHSFLPLGTRIKVDIFPPSPAKL